MNAVFFLELFPNSRINWMAFDTSNCLSAKRHIYKGVGYSSFSFSDGVPDVYDLQFIQENITIIQNTPIIWSWTNMSSSVFARWIREISLIYAEENSLTSFTYTLNFSGSLESDFRTFYSICSAFLTEKNTQLW